MPLPGNVSLVLLTGKMQYIDDTLPATSATVEITPTGSPWLLDPGENTILLPKTVPCTVDAQGRIVGPASAVGPDGHGVKLPATDDSDLSPTGTTYDVTIRVPGLEPNTFSVALPSSPSTVDLADLTPVSAVTPTFTPLTQAAADARYARAQAPVTLGWGATLATDASASSHFRCTLTGGPTTLANPTNGTDGQKVVWELTQDATGGRTLVLGSKFRLGSDLPSVVLSTAANSTDYLGAIYNAARDKWDVIALAKGVAG